MFSSTSQPRRASKCIAVCPTAKAVIVAAVSKTRARAYLVRPAWSIAAAAVLVAETTYARSHLHCSSIDYAPSATRAAAASPGTKELLSLSNGKPNREAPFGFNESFWRC